MGMNSSLNRLLADPDSRERAVLEVDLNHTEDEIEGNATPSFLNTLAGDLDTRVVGIHKNTMSASSVIAACKAKTTLKKKIKKK
jgi:hypothetical protein